LVHDDLCDVPAPRGAGNPDKIGAAVMIRVELRRVPQGGRHFVTIGTLEVADDGTYELDDPGGVFPLELLSLVADGDGQPRQVSFQDDPATWARNLSGHLRTGYLVPVITDEDAPDVADERH
jgi:hypothetical protein